MENKTLSDFISWKLDGLLLSELNNSFECLNQGGCGIVAYFLAKELCNIGIEAKIAWIGNGMGGKAKFDELIKNNKNLTLLELNMNNIRCFHCMVYLNGNLIDSTGVYTDLKFTRYTGLDIENIITWQEIESIAFSDIGWNSSFDRKQIPQIEDKVKSIISNL